MISSEPVIRVGIIEGAREITGEFHGTFAEVEGGNSAGKFEASVRDGVLAFASSDNPIQQKPKLSFRAQSSSSFSLNDVTIGINFHWERKERQEFSGNLTLIPRGKDTLTAINEVGVEEYLKSVISSEMSAEAPAELLKAHAITSRSWLVAMLEREKKNVDVPAQRSFETKDEIVRWYDREDHADFDVCADDHCQRYQGVSKIISDAANRAVDETRGLFLVYDRMICDARFSKSCGGISERFENCWEPVPHAYLTDISDAREEYSPIANEQQARSWIKNSPKAFCNTTDGKILRQVLPSFDQETTDFFRWSVSYTQTELRDLLLKRSGIEFGEIKALVPVERGPSARILKLRIEGTKRTLTVGKELEIRRWLSASHLYSSAFIVDTVGALGSPPSRFTLKGAGWGHGVGLCQIGAAVMATQGFSAEEIVKHYFRGAELKKLY